MVETLSDGKTVLWIFAPDASWIEVVGSFTGWGRSPLKMERLGDGWFRAEVDLGPGEHEFHYRIDGRDTLADYAADGVRMNLFGSWVSHVRVPRTSRCEGSEGFVPGGHRRVSAEVAGRRVRVGELSSVTRTGAG